MRSPPAAAPSGLDTFKPYLLERLMAYPEMTATRLWEEIQKLATARRRRAVTVAREPFALLPATSALVHVGVVVLNDATGNTEAHTLLSVGCSQDDPPPVSWTS